MHNVAMKRPIETAVAFGIGYSLGTAARRVRAVRSAGAAGRSIPVPVDVGRALSKVKAVAFLGFERLRDTIGARLGWRDGDEAADAIAADLVAEVVQAINGRGGPTALAAPTRFRPLRGSPAAGAPIPAGAAWRASSPRSA